MQFQKGVVDQQICWTSIILFAIISGLCNGHPPELEILPSRETQIKSVGKSTILSCRPRVDDTSLISDFEWRDTKNQTIKLKTPSLSKSQMYTELNIQDMVLSLIIPSISENLAGNYTCIATYARTEHLQASVRLETIVAITWIDAPLQQFPIVGKDYKIRCEVAASPAPTVVWSKNNQEIMTNERYVIESKGLIIKSVQESDDGIYTCRAAVMFTGELEERHIQIEVHTPPKMIESDENVRKFVEGESASLTCQATGKPKPSYKWIKISTQENLAVTERFTVNEYTGDLIIKNIEQSDHSDYKCIAKNNAGSVERIVTINVLVKPKIYEYLNVSISENTEAKLICKASGRPAPEISFRKFSNEKPFLSGTQYTDDRITVDPSFDNTRGESTAILIINPLYRSDDDLYECIAKNEGGVDIKNGHLTVEFKPSFSSSKNQPPVWSWDGKPANLSCLAESIPNATIEWHIGEKILENGPNFKIIGTGPQSNLIVKPVNSRFYTMFKCVATNKHGKSEHFVELKEAQAPKEVIQAKVEVMTASTIRFGITPPPTYGGLPLTAFTVEYKPEVEYDWKVAKNKTWSVDSPYILENLIPQTTYNFRFAAHNAVGRGPWSANQLQTMPRRSNPGEPKILTNNAMEGIVVSPYADHYELRWKIPEDNGEPIDVYQIKYCPVHKVNDKWTEMSESCGSEEINAVETSAYELNRLLSDRHYKVELRAHNAIGYSTPAELIIRTARGKDPSNIRHERTNLSSVAIITMVIGAVLIILIIVDLSCFCVNRAGILMFICEKVRSKPVEDDEAKLGSLYGWRFPLPYCSQKEVPVLPPTSLPLPVKLTSTPVDEKEPLKTEVGKPPIIDDSMKRNTSVEFDGRRVYSKTGEIIGKNSAV